MSEVATVGVGTASIDGIPFTVNPTGLQWNYKVRMASHKTIGGKVIQLLGWNMGDLVVQGHFGNMVKEKQKALFDHLKAIANYQVPQLGVRAADPVRFLWPEFGWDFWIYLKSFVQNGAGNVSIERNVRHVNPSYTLTMFVYEDNGNIIKAASQSAQVAYLKRVSAGLGWRQTEWNGHETVQQLQDRLQGQTIMDYAFAHYGIIPNGISVSIENTPNTPPPSPNVR